MTIDEGFSLGSRIFKVASALVRIDECFFSLDSRAESALSVWAIFHTVDIDWLTSNFLLIQLLNLSCIWDINIIKTSRNFSLALTESIGRFSKIISQLINPLTTFIGDNVLCI